MKDLPGSFSVFGYIKLLATEVPEDGCRLDDPQKHDRDRFRMQIGTNLASLLALSGDVRHLIQVILDISIQASLSFGVFTMDFFRKNNLWNGLVFTNKAYMPNAGCIPRPLP